MKKILALLTILAVAGMLLGCATIMSPATGMIYTDTQGPVGVGSGTNASKTGQACATSILGVLGTGDASIGAAMAAGGIKNIAYVDHTSKSILGLYGEYCTVVKGN